MDYIFYYTFDCLIITIYYFLGGLFLSYFMEKLFLDIDYHEHNKELKDTFVLFVDILFSIFIINIFALILRIYINKIPFPLSDYVMKRTTFLIDGGIVLSLSILLFQKNFTEKCKLLAKRLNVI